jgi:hypothetical protein
LRGKETTKTPAVGMKEGDTGKVYAKVMLPDEEDKSCPESNY